MKPKAKNDEESPLPEPRDLHQELISAPLVTTFSLQALVDSPQFQQKIVLASGRSVSYSTCGSRTGSPVLFFYGLGGSSRQIATLHAQAVRFDIKLICIDRPGTGLTDPFNISKISKQKDKNGSRHEATFSTSSCHDSNQDINTGTDTHLNPYKVQKQRPINRRVDHVCREVMAVLDKLLPGARFGMMGHSCGIYYIMRILDLYPERVLPGPIALITPWVPFNECPGTTSQSFKFLKHVPRSVVWAVTSSFNHLGSALMSSSNALSGTGVSSKLSKMAVLDEDDEANGASNKSSRRGTSLQDRQKDKKPRDPFVVQYERAFEKVMMPALIHDINQQHSSGYNAEIQMCISNVGFDIASLTVPEGVTVNAYLGHLDGTVPIEASREMARKCGWRVHEFKYSGHGGPRMKMYAMEDYALAVQSSREESMDEKQG
ncbi:hypothetical protein EMPS_02077 [Entomortierella parvispora]|uniref:AB hydrolase-1 domain-containing protein n=1 Tax=Entomortierella parvispora TaxID=205924 RepID=A0A9P3LTA3_9FUNG|nr:hypothetical protein EMPS_02077 [Entomortierella parvispora]